MTGPIPNLTPDGFEWRYYPPKNRRWGAWGLGYIDTQFLMGFREVWWMTEEFAEYTSTETMPAIFEEIFVRCAEIRENLLHT